jgi:hypothetical protein
LARETTDTDTATTTADMAITTRQQTATARSYNGYGNYSNYGNYGNYRIYGNNKQRQLQRTDTAHCNKRTDGHNSQRKPTNDV